MLRIYNSHFTGSCLWWFNSEGVNKLCNSWNTNLKVILDLPWSTHCYIVEQLSGNQHAKQMIFSRYIKFLDNIVKNKRNSLASLLKIAMQNCNSITGSNIRYILNETGVLIVPGVTRKTCLKDYTVYSIPDGEEWRIPLITSLIEMREQRWEIDFDEECPENLSDDAIYSMISRACID